MPQSRLFCAPCDVTALQTLRSPASREALCPAEGATGDGAVRRGPSSPAPTGSGSGSASVTARPPSWFHLSLEARGLPASGGTGRPPVLKGTAALSGSGRVLRRWAPRAPGGLTEHWQPRTGTTATRTALHCTTLHGTVLHGTAEIAAGAARAGMSNARPGSHRRGDVGELRPPLTSLLPPRFASEVSALRAQPRRSSRRRAFSFLSFFFCRTLLSDPKIKQLLSERLLDLHRQR